MAGAGWLAHARADPRARRASWHTEVGRLQSDRARIETRAVAALETAAKRIEKLAVEDA